MEKMSTQTMEWESKMIGRLYAAGMNPTKIRRTLTTLGLPITIEAVRQYCNRPARTGQAGQYRRYFTPPIQPEIIEELLKEIRKHIREELNRQPTEAAQMEAAQMEAACDTIITHALSKIENSNDSNIDNNIPMQVTVIANRLGIDKKMVIESLMRLPLETITTLPNFQEIRRYRIQNRKHYPVNITRLTDPGQVQKIKDTFDGIIAQFYNAAKEKTQLDKLSERIAQQLGGINPDIVRRSLERIRNKQSPQPEVTPTDDKLIPKIPNPGDIDTGDGVPR